MDWNNDGKKDIVTGENNGNIRIYLNTGTDADPAFSGYTLLQVGGVNFDSGYYSWIHVADWNSDGLLDVLSGETSGTIFLLINEGTLGSPLFNRQTKLKNGGNLLDVGSRSSPTVVDLNRDGKKDLLSGESGGTILYFENIGTDEAPQFNGFTKLAVNGSIIDVGYDPHPDVVDWDNDGVMDVITGEFYGTIMIYRAKGPLFASYTALPESTGGVIDLTLNAGAAYANSNYHILGSITGTEPGLQIPNGPHLPLNWDYFTDLTIQLANTPAFVTFRSTLDASGKGSAYFNTLGALPVGFAGTQISFAYLLYEPATSTIFYSSNAVIVEVVP